MKRLTLPPWMRDLTLRYRRSVLVALALGFAASGFSALLMFTAGYLISDTALIGTTLFAIMIPVACVQLFGVGRPLARYLERLVSHSWVLRITSDLRLALYRNFLARSNDPARVRSAGEYLGLLADDVAHLQNLYLRVAFPCAIALLIYAATCVAFGMFSLPFALMMLLLLAIDVIAIPACALAASRTPIARLKHLKSEERVQLADDLFGALDWVLAGRSEAAVGKHVKTLDDIGRTGAAIRLVQRTVELSQVLTLGLVLCLVLAWASSMFCEGGQSPNWIAAFALGFFPIIESFSLLPAAAVSANDHREAIGRLDDRLDWDVAPNEQKMAITCECALGLRLENVSYRYPRSANDALDKVSLSIPAGQKVAVLGKSGAGKSTFAAIARGSLHPVTGSVSVVDEGETRPLSPEYVGYIGQSEHIFNRSVRDNLKLGKPGASDEELWAALEKVGLSEVVGTYAKGLDTVLGETGMGLSGGQAHRLALARVLVADYPIIVIDEPFAALDPQTEEEILDTLLDAFANRTLIVITHHLARVERFDRVVFFDDGKIALDGAPGALMDNNAYFRKLVSLDRA